jgi:hypothetical protein
VTLTCETISSPGSTPQGVAGIKSERWPGSCRNAGRHQIGIPGRLGSESADLQLLTNREKTLLVDALKELYALPELLVQLGLARSSYFYHRARVKMADKHLALRQTITDIFELNHRCYGVCLRRRPPGRASLAALSSTLRRRLRWWDGWRGGDHHGPGTPAALEHGGQAATSVRGVAARHGICESLLFTWRRQVRQGTLVAEPDVPMFMPVQMISGATMSPSASASHPVRPVHPVPASRAAAVTGVMEIELVTGQHVRVGSDVNLSALRRVLAALRE